MAEKKVIDTMVNAGWALSFQRAKTKISEIDLIFYKPHKICLVEVKKLNNEWRVFERISENQLKNLRLNRIYFSRSFSEYNVMSYVCFVKDQKTYFTEIN